VRETFHEPPPKGHGSATLVYVESKKHKGDLMTKYLDKPALSNALELIKVRRQRDLGSLVAGVMRGECGLFPHETPKILINPVPK
jgi:hypothetical protein